MLDFGDLMILGLAFPNLIGVVLLSGKVKTMLDDALLRAGAFEAGAPAASPPHTLAAAVHPQAD